MDTYSVCRYFMYMYTMYPYSVCILMCTMFVDCLCILDMTSMYVYYTEFSLLGGWGRRGAGKSPTGEMGGGFPNN